MRTKLISFILLSLLFSGNKNELSAKSRAQILEKKNEIQSFVLPTKLKNHPEWLNLKAQHELEIRQLRKFSKKMTRDKFRDKFLEVKKRQKEERYRLFIKLNQ